MIIKCPICKKEVKLGAKEFPFCSERCRDVDLGNWATEQYRIPGKEVQIAPDEEDD